MGSFPVQGVVTGTFCKTGSFFFTSDHVVLDVLPVWSDGVSRFMMNRKKGNKPADDLKTLILECGEKWHSMVSHNTSQSYASFYLATENLKKGVSPDSIQPDRTAKPRLSETERRYIRVLHIKKSDLVKDSSMDVIKRAYKKMAKVYHPDAGGDEDKFKLLNEAHQKMLLWAENPQYTCRRALKGCWAYDGNTGRWSPPL